MMAVIRFLSEPFWQQLGVTLTHFLWQGLAVALVVAAAVRLLRLGHGHGRYSAYLMALTLMAVCPLLTFIAIGRPAETEAVTDERGVAAGASAATGIPEGPPVGDVVVAPAGAVKTARADAVPEPTGSRLQDWLPWAVGFWMLGVTVLSLRLLLGYVGIQRWRRCVQPLPQELTEGIDRLARRLGLPEFSRIFLCPAISEATAVGYLRPMVLLPAAMLTQMDPAMIEAVVAHELAHIRRLDLWVNLAQRIVETLLFYHPAVWWLSNRLRAEREFCCDEMAVAATGERLTYASALKTAQRERLAAAQPALALGLGRGKRPTLTRVRHILGLPPTPSDSRFWLAGAIAVAVLAILAMPAASLMSARADSKIAEDSETLMLKLIEAAEAGDIDQVKTLIAGGADVNAHDRKDATALHYAAQQGHLEVARLLLARGADVNAGAQAGWTPLFAATANKGHRQIAELLLKNQARVNDADTAGYTPLYYAIWTDDEETVKTLIAHGADVNRTPRGDYSPLVYAIWQWHAGNVKALMEAGADINAKDGDGWTPLYWAIDEGAPNVIQLFVEAGVEMSSIHRAVLDGNPEQVKEFVESGTEVDTRDGIGRPLSHWALAAGQMEVFDYLLDEGADVTIATNQGSTLLHKAGVKGLADAVKLLIAKGATVNARTKRGETPLFLAARRGHIEVCQLLITNGADVNAALNNGRHPLGDATLRGHEDVVKLLLANGADVNLSVNNYGVALQAAACYGHPALVDILIAGGADVNANTRNGTPLHLAARAGNRIDDETVGQITKKLLDHGADVHATDKQSGCTPLHIASQRGRSEAARLLIAAGADVNAKDNQGRTPLSYAEGLYATREVAELLRKHGAKETDSAAQADQPTGKSQQQAVEDGRALAQQSIEAAEGSNINPVAEPTARAEKRTSVEKKEDAADSSVTPAGKKYLERLKEVFARPVDVDARDSWGHTILHRACMQGYGKVAEFLIGKGADVNAGNITGITPLHTAAGRGHADVVKLLLDRKADVNARDNHDATPLWYAKNGVVYSFDVFSRFRADTTAWWNPENPGCKKAVELLVERGAVAHAPIISLHEAANFGLMERVRSLVAEGADVNAMDDRLAATPLHLAAYNNQTEVVEFLIGHGADVNARNKWDRTPLHIAMDQGRTEIVELLRKHGATLEPSAETARVKAATLLFESATSKSAVPERNLEIPEQMQACAANLRKIHAAIKKYEKDKGQLPAWLSDLVPNYVSKETLLCPTNPEARVQWPVDPKLPCGYAYEFSPFRAYARFGGAPTDGMTQRDRKMAQVAFFGDVVPLCRCRLHGAPHGPMNLNLSVGGKLYLSGPQWESLIMPDYEVGSELVEKPLPPAGSRVK